MQILFYILLFILGACFGSFLCCQARRLHYRATHSSKSKLNQRSICMHCKYQLKWYDNIPIISWLCLRGRCRKCKTKIGLAEILSELGLALAFLLVSTSINPLTADPWQWVLFIIMLIFILNIGFLAIYDGIYGELPTKYLVTAIVIASIYVVIKIVSTTIQSGFAPNLITDPLFSVLILGGIYLILYLISKGKWVGDGDWLLGTALALVLFYPFTALVALFLANLLASLIMAPSAILRKNHHIHFGPFLSLAFILAPFVANLIIV